MNQQINGLVQQIQQAAQSGDSRKLSQLADQLKHEAEQHGQQQGGSGQQGGQQQRGGQGQGQQR